MANLRGAGDDRSKHNTRLDSLEASSISRADLDNNCDDERTDWDAVTLLQTQFSDIRWAVPRMIPAGLGLLSAKPKVGKSFLALRIAVSVATGRTVLDRYQPERGRVL